MKSFKEYFEENWNEKLPEKVINGAWFSEHGFPMIVTCTDCGMTMALPNAYVDEDGYIYCSQCARDV